MMFQGSAGRWVNVRVTMQWRSERGLHCVAQLSARSPSAGLPGGKPQAVRNEPTSRRTSMHLHRHYDRFSQLERSRSGVGFGRR